MDSTSIISLRKIQKQFFQPAGLNIKKTPIYPRINTSDADVGISPFVLLHPDKETSPSEYTDQHLQPLAREMYSVTWPWVTNEDEAFPLTGVYRIGHKHL